MRARILIAILFLSGLSATALTPAAAQPAGSVKRGLSIAKQQCASCHAIGRTGRSKLRNAPPLRTLAARYPLEQLEESFAEGVMVSHKDQPMPSFEMTPNRIADLIAYIKSVSPKKRR